MKTVFKFGLFFGASIPIGFLAYRKINLENYQLPKDLKVKQYEIIPEINTIVENILKKYDSIGIDIKPFPGQIKDNVSPRLKKSLQQTEKFLNDKNSANSEFEGKLKDNIDAENLVLSKIINDINQIENLIKTNSFELHDLRTLIDIKYYEIQRKIVNLENFSNFSILEEKLDELGKKFNLKIKNYKIDFSNYKKDDFGKLLIIEKLNELSNLKEDFIKEKCEIVKDIESQFVNEFEEGIKSTSEMTDSLRDDLEKYKELLKLGYNLKNQGLAYNQVLNQNSELKKEIEENYKYDNLNESKIQFHNNYFQKSLNIAKSNSNSIFSNIEKIHKNIKFNHYENEEFLKDINKINYLKYLPSLRNIFSSIEIVKDVKVFQKILDDSYKNGDRFTFNLIKKANINGKSTHSDLNQSFEEFKNSLIFEHMKKNGFLGFFVGYFWQKASCAYFLLLDENYNKINDNDHQTIRIFKSLAFIERALRRGDYIDAYEYTKFLKDLEHKTENFTEKLREEVKNKMIMNTVLGHLDN